MSQARRERAEVYELLEEKLSNPDLGLLERYDTLFCEAAFLEEKLKYQQGFRDCVWLLQWLGFVRRP